MIPRLAGYRVALVLAFGGVRALGCICLYTPPPCEAYAETQMIFLGTVTGVVEGKVRMKVDTSYKGVPEKALELVDDVKCGALSFNPGEQYLMYTQRRDSGAIPARGCTRSRHVRDAMEDLDGRAKAPDTGTIFGHVTIRTNDYSGEDQPAAGAMISLTGLPNDTSTSADSNGFYSFVNLDPGKYHVHTGQDGYIGEVSKDSLNVAARGCAESCYGGTGKALSTGGWCGSTERRRPELR